jgi:RNA polymerase sigma-70 factor (ECF subfamily)
MNQTIPSRPQTTAVLGETELVERARRGDELAFRTIIQRNNQRLYRLARSVLKDASEAEDVVQES